MEEEGQTVISTPMPGKVVKIPVKIGDSWTVDTKMQMSMPIETITQYTLKEVKDGIAILSVKGTLVSKGNIEAMGNKMETDLSGTNSGETSLDITTGMVLNSHLRIELYGKMKSMGKDIDFDGDRWSRTPLHPQPVEPEKALPFIPESDTIFFRSLDRPQGGLQSVRLSYYAKSSHEREAVS